MMREEAVRRIEKTADEKLMKLDLSGLKLEEVPSEIVKCTHLTQLNLNSNQITQIPETLGQLSSNEITSIPAALGQLFNLQFLYLFENPITSIPEAIEQLSKLEIVR